MLARLEELAEREETESKKKVETKTAKQIAEKKNDDI